MSQPSTTTPMPHEPSQAAPDAPSAQADAQADIRADAANWAELAPRKQRVILVCDVVESVRWMEQYEDEAIVRWSQFASEVRERVAPAHGGQVIKSTGDGLLMEFQTAPSAVAAATALQKIATRGNERLTPDRQMLLRIGIHQAQARRDAHDLYGHGVNLAARITTLANPGEIIVTPEVRDHLTDSLDGDIEDMGECYLKHLQEPQRVYRVGEVQDKHSQLTPASSQIDLRASITILPFANPNNDAAISGLGHLVSDGLLNIIGRSKNLKLISSLSANRLFGRKNLLELAANKLDTNYILSGNFWSISSTKILLISQLTEVKTQQIIWTERSTGEISDLFQKNSEICSFIAAQAIAKLFDTEAEKSVTQPLPSLPSYSLFLSAVTLMHRASQTQFHRAYEALDRLIEMHRGHCTPYAWMAKWYVLKVAQGWSTKPEADAQIALDYCSKALDNNNASGLALAVMGQVHGYLKQDLNKAESYYLASLDVNPNESLAYLWRGINAAFIGDAQNALQLSEHAMELSPLDPIAYYYKSLSASAAVTSGQYGRAIELAQDSIRLNRTHSSTYRALAMAQVFHGEIDQAKLTIKELLKLEPSFTVSSFMKRFPGRQAAPEHAKKLAQALVVAGLPI